MADDASFHSCSEELHCHHQNHHHQRHHQHRYCEATSKEHAGNGCSASCCYSSDTDDEAQFLTASNSPMSLEASNASATGCFGPGASGGNMRPGDAPVDIDFLACLAGDLERTLGGESCQSESPSSPMVDNQTDGPDAVASSTVTAQMAKSTRPLNYSGFVGEQSGLIDNADDDVEEFPPPLASSSSASLAGISKMQQKKSGCQSLLGQGMLQHSTSTAKGPEATHSTTAAAAAEAPTAASVLGDAENTTIAAGLLPRLLDGDESPAVGATTPAGSNVNHNNDQNYCYQDNDLTAHRPAARRTRSGPTMLRQTYSSAQELAWLQNRHQDDVQLLQPAPPPPTAQKMTSRLNNAQTGADSIDFPTQLRKRVRFADALGFDLASVVLIAGGANSNGIADRACLLNDDDLMFELQLRASAVGPKAFTAAFTPELFSGFCLNGDTAESSELNRGRLFATETESLSQSGCPMTPSAVDQLSVEKQQSEDLNWASITPWDPAQMPTPCRPVTLESVRFYVEPAPMLELTARVLNLAPEKRVIARVTFNNWRHQSDWTLRYCQTLPTADCCPGVQERFSARLQVPEGAAGLELALSYSVGGQVHWDNNAGRNYIYVYKMNH